MDMLEIWNQVLENLEGNVSPVGFNIHIKTAVPVCSEIEAEDPTESQSEY